MKHVPVILFVAVLTSCVLWLPLPSRSQNPSVVYIKQLDEHSHLVKMDGQEMLMIDLAKVKEMKANEIKPNESVIEIAKLNDSLNRTEHDLDLCKQNVQDERIEKAKIHTMYDDQVKLSGECFALLKRGGGRVNRILGNPITQTAIHAGETVATMKRCR